MSGPAITTLVLIVAVIAAGVGVVVWKIRQRQAIAAMSPLERAVYDAEAKYASAVKEATKSRDARVKEQKARVKAAASGVRDAQRIGSRTIAAYSAKDGRAEMTSLTLTLRGRTVELNGSVSAAVDATGNVAVDRRTTAGRVVAGAVIAGPVGAVVGAAAKKKQVNDFRALYLTVTGPGFSVVFTCDPDTGGPARQFAAAVNSCAMNADRVRAQRSAALKSAQARLEEANADTGAVRLAESRLSSVMADRSEIEAAKLALAGSTE